MIDDLLEELSQLESPSERLAWVLRQNLVELARLVNKDRSSLANYRMIRRQPALQTLAAILPGDGGFGGLGVGAEGGAVAVRPTAEAAA